MSAWFLALLITVPPLALVISSTRITRKGGAS
jgi:hypothetical protein